MPIRIELPAVRLGIVEADEVSIRPADPELTESARDVLTVVYAPINAAQSAVEAAVAKLSERLTDFAGAKAVRSRVDS